MSRFAQFIHDNQIVVAALILFLAVLVYCIFTRYELIRLNESGGVVVDRLTGSCYTIYGTKVQKQYWTPVKPN